MHRANRSAFIQSPWTYKGVGPAGEALVTHPLFRDPVNNDVLVHRKMVIYSPHALRQIMRPRRLATAIGLVINGRARMDAG